MANEEQEKPMEKTRKRIDAPHNEDFVFIHLLIQDAVGFPKRPSKVCKLEGNGASSCPQTSLEHEKA